VTPSGPWAARGAAAALALAAAATAATEVSANDLWWHLKAGEWIVVNGAVPRLDPFTFTSFGTPWVDHGWLWQLAAWSLFALAGFAGLALLKLASAAIVAAAAFRALCRSRWNLHAGSLLVVACLAGMRFRLTDRPETASLALLAIYLFILTSPDLPTMRRAGGAFLLTALWANVHAGALLAPALAAACALGSLLELSRARSERAGAGVDLRDRAKGEALAGAASFAGLLFNPWGYQLLLVPLKLAGALADPRLVNPEWVRPAWSTFSLFHTALAGGLFLCAFRILRREDPSGWRPFLLLAGSGALALTGARHIGVFFVVAAFAAALAWKPAPGAPEVRPAGGVTAAIWGLGAAVLFPIFPSTLTAPPGFGVVQGTFPAEETDYVSANLETPRALYNDVGHGGYLIWRLYPEDRVFIDGRNEIHATLLHEIAEALDDGRAWSALLDRYGIQAAIVRYREEQIRLAGAPPEDPGRSFSSLHFPRTKWALVHWGDSAMVFVRRGGKHDALIVRDEYRFAQPEDWRYLLAQCQSGNEALLLGILTDLTRRARQAPGSQRADEQLEEFRALQFR